MASAGEELTLCELLTPGTVGPAGEAGMSAYKRTLFPAWLWPRASASHLLSRILGVFVAVPSPWLVRTLGVGEGCSCPKARVEVRVDREPAAGA